MTDNKSTQRINILTAWLVGILALFVFGVTYIAFLIWWSTIAIIATLSLSCGPLSPVV